MSTKKRRLQDSFTISTSSFTKAANGDLVESVDGTETFRCTVVDRGSALVDRTYEVPELDFDYMLEVRSETFAAANVQKASRLTTSKTGSTSFQIVETVTPTPRLTKIFISAAE